MLNKGVYTALVSPFDNNEFDFSLFGNLIQRQVNCHVTGIVVCGSTAESFAINDELFARIVKCACTNSDRLHVIANVGTNFTRQSVHRATVAQEMGVDAVMAVAPYYNKPSQHDIFEHFSTIAQSIDIPLLLYSVESRVGYALSYELVAALFKEHSNIIGIKYSDSNISTYVKLVRDFPDRMIFVGDDINAYSMLPIGQSGLISVASNIIPNTIVDIVNTIMHGNNIMRNKFLKTTELFDALNMHTNPISVKYIMGLQGHIKQEIHLPLSFHDVDKTYMRKIAQDYYEK